MPESTRSLDIPQDEIEKGKTMAIIAYLIFFIPLLVEDAKKNKFAMYHTEQALLFFIVNVVCMVLSTVTCGIGLILYVPFMVCLILGIVNAAQGQVKPVPLIGQF